MLLPDGVRMGMVSRGGPLLICTGSPPYNVSSGRKTSCWRQLIPSRRHHTSHHGHSPARAFIRQAWLTSLQFRDTRANSSLARAKAAHRKGRTPHQPANQPQTGRTAGGGESAASILSALAPIVTKLENERARYDKLKSDYYKAVDKDADVLWLTWKERRETPDHYANGWVSRPRDSRNSQRYGISRQNVYVRHLTEEISDPEVRKRIVNWEQDTCKDLAPLFKEMVMSRAKIGHLEGFKSYFDYRSQFKMMSSSSVERFLKGLKSQIDPCADAFMESTIEQKMKDLNYDFTIKGLRQKLKHGKTIRDYQIHHPEAQINWGDYSCTYILGFGSP
jgi:Peptidase family M3